MPAGLSLGASTGCLRQAKSRPCTFDEPERHHGTAALGARDVLENSRRTARTHTAETSRNGKIRARRLQRRKSGVREPAGYRRQCQFVFAHERETALSGRALPNGSLSGGESCCKLSEVLPRAGAT